MTFPSPMPGSDQPSPKDDVHAPFLEDLQEEVEQHKLAVTGGHALYQPFPSLGRGIPVQGEWSSGSPPAAQAVVQSVKVPAEVSAGFVDDLTDCTAAAEPRGLPAVALHAPGPAAVRGTSFALSALPGRLARAWWSATRARSVPDSSRPSTADCSLRAVVSGILDPYRRPYIISEPQALLTNRGARRTSPGTQSRSASARPMWRRPPW